MLTNAATLLIELKGNLCGQEAMAVGDKLPRAALSTARHVVLSLRKVEAMDEAGLLLLVRLYSQLRTRGSSLVVSDQSHQVGALLAEVGLAHLLRVSAEERSVPAMAFETAEI